jgi:DNA modification methylase
MAQQGKAGERVKPYYQEDGITIYHGDCFDVLTALDAESVQCVVTSPPYYGLRDYGVDGQIGLEKTPESYVDKLVAVFREVRRVLKDDGTVWLNLGDSYWGGKGKSSQAWSTEHTDRGVLQAPQHQICGMGETRPTDGKHDIIKPKDLIGIPWRVAFALQADGWWLRQDIIWHKPNPMPESVTDRCTKSHEYIFLLTKSARYFYDSEAIKEPFCDDRMGNPNGGGQYSVGSGRNDSGALKTGKWNEDGKTTGRNRRSVWTIATKPFKEAHFATFPPAIPEICIKAGSKPGDIILDPFSGSGTTGNVAERLGRKYIGIELNPAYSEIGEKRIDAARLPLAEQWG